MNPSELQCGLSPEESLGWPPKVWGAYLQPQQVHYVEPWAQEDCSQALGFNVVYPVRLGTYLRSVKSPLFFFFYASFLERECLLCACPTIVFAKREAVPFIPQVHSWRAVCLRMNGVLSLPHFWFGWWMRRDWGFDLILEQGKTSGATGTEWMCFAFYQDMNFGTPGAEC